MTLEQSSGDHFETNIDRFSSEELLEQYTERATAGLFPEERTAIDRYFGEQGTVLDVGCGVGRTTRPLAQRGFDVVGIDLSTEMIDAARRLSPEIDFRVDDATDLSFETAAFDYALFSHNGIDYIHPTAKRERAFRELRRVLKPGGVLVFSTHNAWYRFPAIARDREFLRTFYLNRTNLPRLFDRYKKDTGEADLHTYMSNPIRQRRQLRRCGFEPLELVGKREGASKYLEAMLYFATRRPPAD